MPYMRWGEICGRARTSRSALLGLKMGIGGGRICDHPPPQLLDGQKGTHGRHAACARCTDPPCQRPNTSPWTLGESLLHASGVRCLFPWQPRGGNSESRLCSPVPSMSPHMPAPTLHQCWGALRSPSACVRGRTHIRENPTGSKHARARFPNEYLWGRGGVSGETLSPSFPFP